jgi:hypothetical protein
MFRKYKVEASSVADFLSRYYKPERYTGRGPEYAAVLLADHQADFENTGFDIISNHDSVTGNCVAYYGSKED